MQKCKGAVAEVAEMQWYGGGVVQVQRLCKTCSNEKVVAVWMNARALADSQECRLVDIRGVGQSCRNCGVHRQA